MAFVIDLAAPLASELRRLASEQLESASDLVSRATTEPDAATCIHETRKAMKSLRALVRLFRGALPSEERVRAESHFRSAAGALATAREAEALRGAFASLHDRAGERAAETSWERGRAALAASIAAASGRAPEAAAFTAALATLADARRQVDTWALTREGWAAVAPGLARTYARGRREFRAALERPNVERLHEWRKHVKYHQHHMRLLRGLWPAALGARRDALDELGECLGDDHDLALVELELARHATGAALDDLRGLIADRRGELLEVARRLGRRLYVEERRDFVRRLAVCWETQDRGPAQALSAGTKLA